MEKTPKKCVYKTIVPATQNRIEFDETMKIINNQNPISIKLTPIVTTFKTFWSHHNKTLNVIVFFETIVLTILTSKCKCYYSKSVAQ